MACTNSTLFFALCFLPVLLLFSFPFIYIYIYIDLHQFLDLESYCGHNKLKIFQICPN
ncbi:hypothetical protein OIU79_000412 [Salix purpurea]|uniref:Uncharacterized protein n=1 Tax=Salix purpurea TaxID=77065 RepID=A0A9Q0V174_SALPP|nr:hypothetical protein OIU79_000412 [Salix purpurea]